MNKQELSVNKGFTFKLDNLTYTIKPLNLTNPTHLRCIVSVTNNNGYTYLDKLDLYQASARRVFAKKAVTRLETDVLIIEQDLVKLITKLEESREQPETPQEQEMPPMQKKEALQYLKDPDLINNIIASLHKCGYVGEEMNLLTAYLAATSRKLQAPLSLMIMSRSGAGKSALQKAILRLLPEEEYQHFTRITDQVLFYKGEDELRHKLIAIEESRGAQGAAYSLRNLLTSHGLSISATIKDPFTGILKAFSRKVGGPVSIIITTTGSDEIDYELLNRFIIITIDESQIQTERILNSQRHAKSLPGIIAGRSRQSEFILHQNIQRLLRPLEIVNPYHDKIKFNNNSLIMRRRHLHYLGLIEVVTLLHQYQRPIKKAKADDEEFEYIEITPRDIEIANKIAEKVLVCSQDELMPPARNLYHELINLEKHKQNGNGDTAVKFCRKEIRDFTGWNDYQIRTYLKQLVDLEYAGIVSGNNGIKYHYELLYRGNGAKPFDLIDPKSLYSKTS